VVQRLFPVVPVAVQVDRPLPLARPVVRRVAQAEGGVLLAGPVVRPGEDGRVDAHDAGVPLVDLDLALGHQPEVDRVAGAVRQPGRRIEAGVPRHDVPAHHTVGGRVDRHVPPCHAVHRSLDVRRPLEEEDSVEVLPQERAPGDGIDDGVAVVGDRRVGIDGRVVEVEPLENHHAGVRRGLGVQSERVGPGKAGVDADRPLPLAGVVRRQAAGLGADIRPVEGIADVDLVGVRDVAAVEDAGAGVRDLPHHIDALEELHLVGAAAGGDDEVAPRVDFARDHGAAGVAQIAGRDEAGELEERVVDDLGLDAPLRPLELPFRDDRESVRLVRGDAEPLDVGRLRHHDVGPSPIERVGDREIGPAVGVAVLHRGRQLHDGPLRVGDAGLGGAESLE